MCGQTTICSCFVSPTDAIDFEVLIETLKKLKEGKSVEVPVYDFNTHSRAKYTVSSVIQTSHNLNFEPGHDGHVIGVKVAHCRLLSLLELVQKRLCYNMLNQHGLSLVWGGKAARCEHMMACV